MRSFYLRHEEMQAQIYSIMCFVFQQLINGGTRIPNQFYLIPQPTDHQLHYSLYSKQLAEENKPWKQTFHVDLLR